MLDVRSRLGRAALLLIVAVGVPIAAEAQEVASSLDQLRELVKVGDDVVVTDLQGRQTRGRIAEISSSSISLIAGSTRAEIAESDLDTVSKRDSRWNGTLWGLGAGGVLGAWLASGLEQEYGEDITTSDSVVMTAVAAGVGAGIGFLVDSVIKGRQLVYSKSQAATGRKVRLSPQWFNRRKGVFVSLQF